MQIFSEMSTRMVPSWTANVSMSDLEVSEMHLDEPVACELHGHATNAHRGQPVSRYLEPTMIDQGGKPVDREMPSMPLRKHFFTTSIASRPKPRIEKSRSRHPRKGIFPGAPISDIDMLRGCSCDKSRCTSSLCLHYATLNGKRRWPTLKSQTHLAQRSGNGSRNSKPRTDKIDDSHVLLYSEAERRHSAIDRHQRCGPDVRKGLCTKYSYADKSHFERRSDKFEREHELETSLPLPQEVQDQCLQGTRKFPRLSEFNTEIESLRLQGPGESFRASTHVVDKLEAMAGLPRGVPEHDEWVNDGPVLVSFTLPMRPMTS
jgi:hypothetical protein